MEIVLAIAVVLILSMWGTFAFYGKRFKERLLAHPGFSAQAKQSYPAIRFSYAGKNDPNLKTLREKYDLDTVAGQGTETERMIRLMKWVNRLTSHAVNPAAPKELNALNLIELCKTQRKQLNCWLYSIVLNEIYLSFGYPSRIIHLLPAEGEEKESHYVTAVFSSERKKWVMMDADMGGYLRDEHGVLLGIAEIRRRLVAGKPLMVNKDIGGFSKILGRWSYLWYLSKNIFRYNCQQVSQFDQETHRENKVFVELLPDGFRPELLGQTEQTKRGSQIIYINDEDLFWQVPVENE